MIVLQIQYNGSNILRMKVLIEKTGVERADKMSSKLFERHFKEETGLNIRYGDLARNETKDFERRGS